MINLVNTKEAAKILNVTPLHVRRLLRQGRLIGQKMGRDWVMLKPDSKNSNRK